MPWISSETADTGLQRSSFYGLLRVSRGSASDADVIDYKPIQGTYSRHLRVERVLVLSEKVRTLSSGNSNSEL